MFRIDGRLENKRQANSGCFLISFFSIHHVEALILIFQLLENVTASAAPKIPRETHLSSPDKDSINKNIYIARKETTLVCRCKISIRQWVFNKKLRWCWYFSIAAPQKRSQLNVCDVHMLYIEGQGACFVEIGVMWCDFQLSSFKHVSQQAK